MAWHPEKPILVMASMGGGFVQWNPVGIREFEGLPPTASYRSLAFSPNGQTLWASPSWVDDHTSWERSDVIDLASGTVRIGPAWDTGVAMHPRDSRQRIRANAARVRVPPRFTSFWRRVSASPTRASPTDKTGSTANARRSIRRRHLRDTPITPTSR